MNELVISLLMLVEKLDNGRKPVMAQEQSMGSCGGFLKVKWKRVPSQLASTFIKGFVSLPPLRLSFITLHTRELKVDTRYLIQEVFIEYLPCAYHCAWPGGRYQPRTDWQ